MITLMTAVIVVLIWGIASKQLTDLLDNAFGKVNKQAGSSQRCRVGGRRLRAGVTDSGAALCRHPPARDSPLCAQYSRRLRARRRTVRGGRRHRAGWKAAITNAASERTKSCVTDSLPDSFANGVTASTPTLTGAGVGAVVEVQIASPFPLMGFLGVGSGVLHATGDAMQEQP